MTDEQMKLARAEKLIRDMYMALRESKRVDMYDPYSWAELNEELMERIREFM